MKRPAYSFVVLALCAVALAGCNRNDNTQPAANAPASAASAPASSASASASAAPASAAVASGPVVAPTAAPAPTDAQRQTGATIAAQGGGGAVAACNSCHGAQGEGNAGGGFPRIAGQSYAYLAHELDSYAGGSRKNAVMQPIASAMTPQQRQAAAAYFASLNPGGAATGAAGAASGTSTSSTSSAAAGPASGTSASSAATGVASGTSTPSTGAGSRTAGANAGAAAATRSAGASGRGAQLAQMGDESQGVQACANCHGPGGIGSGELYPYLAGQHANYLTAALNAWRDGTRANDPSGQMPLIAHGLAPQDVSALAAYYAAQPARATAIDAERMAPIGPVAAASGPAVVSGPQAGGTEGSSRGAGTGTESGSPVLGAQSQTPGGTGTASTGAPQQGASAAMPQQGASAAR
jgi:cytochrome c553